MTKPSGKLVRSSTANYAGTGNGFVGANVRFELEYPAYVSFFVVTPRARLITLDSRPMPTEAGYGAGAHEVEIGFGPWGVTPGDVPHCVRPCYLIAVASSAAELDAYDPWRVPPLAPGFASPDSLMVWVAREAIGLADTTAWTATYRRLTNDQIRR